MGKRKAIDDRKPWPPERVRALRARCGITAREAARWVGVSIRTWQRWEQPEDSPSYRPPCGPARVQLDRMANRASMRPWTDEAAQDEAQGP